jgi:hypothetical protein
VFRQLGNALGSNTAMGVYSALAHAPQYGLGALGPGIQTTRGLNRMDAVIANPNTSADMRQAVQLERAGVSPGIAGSVLDTATTRRNPYTKNLPGGMQVQIDPQTEEPIGPETSRWRPREADTAEDRIAIETAEANLAEADSFSKLGPKEEMWDTESNPYLTKRQIYLIQREKAYMKQRRGAF